MDEDMNSAYQKAEPQAGGADGAAAPGAAPQGQPSAEYRATVNQLFREHNRALVKFLLTRLQTEAEAMDVAQEAYVRLLQLDQPGAIGFLRGYLFRIAANLSIDRMRARVPRERAAVELFEELSEPDLIEHRAITREEFDLVCEALKELPASCQRAFLLHVIEGYDQAETARAVGCSERMVRNHVTRALAHCRHRLSHLSSNMERRGS